MFKKILMIGAMLSSSIASPAFAQHLTPADTDFTAGPDSVTLTKPGLGTLVCVLTLSGRTGPDLDPSNPSGTHHNHAATATITGGTNTGPAPCPGITVGPGDVTYSGSGVWTLSDATVTLGTNTLCDGPVDFTFDGSDVVFDSDIAAGSVPGTCHVTGRLHTTPAITDVG